MTSPTTTGPATSVLDSPALRFAVRRLTRFIVSLWVLVTAAFGMIHLIPGDPVRAALGITASQALVDQRRHALGLDQPLIVQYRHFLTGVLTGDLDVSLTSQLPVTTIIGEGMPATLELAVAAFGLAIVIAIPVGTLMAVLTRGGRARQTELAFTTTSVVLGSIPNFVVGVVLVWLVGVNLHWLPVAGKSGAASFVLPVVALAIGPAAILSRILRVELLAVLQADFVRTARAKRLPAAAVYVKHALPNALTSAITLGGLLLSGMVAGTVLVENVFAWPGLGSTIVSSILGKDYPVVQSIVLVYGIGVLAVNLIVDVALSLLDPRSTIRET
ncbi:ABC transporter permease [Amycolatopsis taiwanensis]|uniref:Peptide ABC transporter permease n=1 Tax=Amycolatopsis taiwanensis TaxID=342230 RepID=A0A9W6R7U9_9PSEU|nr:ABC transporter permease [Amycolatopsis taiwanensis]GLY70423.1 peptide ABC transporter permease [Amycolatopsis taiwanensis]